jgi:hypothetical protein
MNQLTTKYNHEIEPLGIQGDGTLVFSPELTNELKEAHGA